jgi:hypothetical protein
MHKMTDNFKQSAYIMTAILLALAFLCGGCGGNNSAVQTTTSTVEPAVTSSSGRTIEEIQAEAFEKYKDQPELIEVAIYAEFQGISIEEAQQRSSITDQFRGVEGLLQTKAPDTFAGFWIQHTPNFTMVAAFTSGGEDIVLQVVSENLMQYVEVRIVKYSMKDLWRDRNQVESFLKQYGLQFQSGISVIDNRVDITVTNRTAIDKAVAEGKLIIPDSVKITVGPLATLE